MNLKAGYQTVKRLRYFTQAFARCVSSVACAWYEAIQGAAYRGIVLFQGRIAK
jgi:hypothetical protein